MADRLFSNSAARRVATHMDEVFASLQHLPFLRKADRQEFGYFRRLFRSACARIDARIDSGGIQPWSRRSVATLREFVKANSFEELERKTVAHRSCLAIPGGTVRVGIFIGSFDPFQMTHLETALRFLSRGKRPVDLVLVVPEGAWSARKPGRADYAYRFDILARQIEDVFRPFVIPLDIGQGQDTIGIVNRLIRIFSDRRLELTHILGSDTLPYAVGWLEQDLAAWQPMAKRFGVDLDFGMFVVRRHLEDDVTELVKQVRAKGIEIQVDRRPIGTPSSTALRERGFFTIVFPTHAVLEKLEVVFRYGMHRNWMADRPGPEYEI